MRNEPESSVSFLRAGSPNVAESAMSAGHLLFRQLLSGSIVLKEDCEKLSREVQDRLVQCQDRARLLVLLAEYGLITGYQLLRIGKGKIFGLVLGNYRILSQLGSGAMGEVFKAEHIELRKVVAVKAVEILDEHDPAHLRRFQMEMRTVAQLHHPNIVSATDAGKRRSRGPDGKTIWYFVMDYVPGRNLEDLVGHGEPLDPQKTCDLAHQVASALAEANKRGLVHRDIKPSNILLTPSGQAKLLDFGLARDLSSRDTRRGAFLGTVHYMSPEQAVDSSTVDIRSDIFSLGATMYWCLTGKRPFAERKSLLESLEERCTQPSPRVRDQRPDVAAALDDAIARMMATKVEDRFQTPQRVMAALEPFLNTTVRGHLAVSPRPHSVPELLLNLPNTLDDHVASHRLLLITSNNLVEAACRNALANDAITCDVLSDGAEALRANRGLAYDVVLVDLELPGTSGSELCRRLHDNAGVGHQKIIAIAAAEAEDDAARLMIKYVNDYLMKPIVEARLRARVLAALCAKDQQDNSDRLNQHLMASSRKAKETPKLAVESHSGNASEWIL